MAAGTVTAATSSLASELLLNKIQNGQVKTSTGKSITAAGRAVSGRLGGQAYAARAAEANMAYGEGFMSTAQNELSGIRDLLQKTKQNLAAVNANTAATGADKTAAVSAAKAVADELKAIVTNTKYNGVAVLGDTAQSFKGDDGVVIKGPAVAASGIIAPVKTAATGSDVSGTITAIDTAIDSLIAKEALLSDTVKELQNRQLLLADKGANLDNAAAGQSLADTSGASNLLSSMLG